MATRRVVSLDDLESRYGFDICVRRDGSEVVVCVSGELDVATAPSLRTVLADLIDDQGNRSVVIDISRVTFLDSTGVGLLAGTRQKLVDAGGQFVVMGPTPAATRVLEVTGLDQLLDVREVERGER